LKKQDRKIQVEALRAPFTKKALKAFHEKIPSKAKVYIVTFTPHGEPAAATSYLEARWWVPLTVEEASLI